MKTSYRFLLVALACLGLAGCDLFDIEDRPDPNGPSLDGILADPSEDNIAALAVGTEAASRVDLNLYLIDVGVVGREYWRTSSADPRFTADLLGRGTSVLDNNTFYITRPWSARYATIRDANTMLQALDLNATLSDDEKAAARGFAKTWKAYQYLLNLNLSYENGIRFIGPGEDEPGPIVGYEEALAMIAALLDESAADLGAGDAFFFPVSVSIGVDLSSPEGFRDFNRALAARVALYRGRNEEALDLLGETFLDRTGDLTAGAYHVFSASSGDLVNPFFLPPDNPVGDALLAHPDYVADLEPGDERISKVFDRGTADTFDDLTSQYGFYVYKSSVDPIPIIRNAELLLIRAEARARTGDLTGAVADLNAIRIEAGLSDYEGAMTQDAVLDEVLRQRRYELYGEGHRWIDGRRFDVLDDPDEFPIDRPGDDVWVMFPIPLAENV
jgi:starch-binding outer membrane protein, SusD/RagB family